MNRINIDQIMEEIYMNIKNRQYDIEPLSFEEVKMCQSAIQNLDGYSTKDFLYDLNYIIYNWNIPGNITTVTSNPLTALVKKVVHKLTRFIIFPLIDFQSSYNASTCRCIIQIKEYMFEIEKYKEKINKMEMEIEELKSQNK